ncbi:MAG: hypothetical protein KGL62_17365, partial [Bradyrhizobium sp.]|uniref:hypothetical protein n=1 Tax=Bradyrhizobium sp. TaxID=376 RepID=UPI00238C9127
MAREVASTPAAHDSEPVRYKAASHIAQKIGLAFDFRWADILACHRKSRAVIGDENARCAPAPIKQGKSVMQERGHLKQRDTLEQRL